MRLSYLPCLLALFIPLASSYPTNNRPGHRGTIAIGEREVDHGVSLKRLSSFVAEDREKSEVADVGKRKIQIPNALKTILIRPQAISRRTFDAVMTRT